MFFGSLWIGEMGCERAVKMKGVSELSAASVADDETRKLGADFEEGQPDHQLPHPHSWRRC